jgi:hypothetical protein
LLISRLPENYSKRQMALGQTLSGRFVEEGRETEPWGSG